MPSKRMLVDAIHPEETRVVVTSGNRLEEFDFESATRRQLRGNIYLAKVTRVEPSLQAAFVDYGGNRHGFLAFSEIHPDYYQIPLADREALLRDQAEENAEAAEADEIAAHGIPAEASALEGEGEPDDQSTEEVHEDGAEAANGKEQVEDAGSGDDDVLAEVPRRRKRQSRQYKIQEVIKRRQVLLVQVVKEERGNKGAALTTYLSLAGRYSVLMPNTARGGGISRKITSAADRKRLREIATELDVPKEMGVILRTAGASRNKAEVKRDFEYLLRLWENVRELTLASTAPTLVYEEGSLIKRSIRDLYTKDIEEVMVAGDEAYKEAKEFMKMIMPSHARHVKPHKDGQPIFSRFNIEAQLDSMFSPRVTLPSGGYIIINPTEALVSIDVNSGKSTREHNIEDTALQTNLEAAEEVARQLRLRDLAGLIVVDFIDMEERRNNRTVEKRLKDALKNDRARIQIGRISHFGLLEMSRQRIRFGVLESSTRTCPHCEGTGLIRSVESLSLAVMRAVEDHVRRRSGQSITVNVPTEVALYILNHKRAALADLEQRFELSIAVAADANLSASQYTIERRENVPGARAPTHVRVDSASMEEIDEAVQEEKEEQPRRDRSRRRRSRDRDEEAAEAVEGTEAKPEATTEAGAEDEEQPRRKRRRGRRGGRRSRGGEGRQEAAREQTKAGSAQPTDEQPPMPAGPANWMEADEDEIDTTPDAYATPAPEQPAEAGAEETPVEEQPVAEQPAEEKKPRRRRRGRGKKAEEAKSAEAETAEGEAAEAQPEADVAGNGKDEAETAEAEPAPAESRDETANGGDEEKPSRRKRQAPPEDEIVVTSSSAGEDKPKRGWWNRSAG